MLIDGNSETKEERIKLVTVDSQCDIASAKSYQY